MSAWDVYAPEPGDNLAGLVVVNGETLTPCEARRLAEDLLDIAEYAERVAGEVLV